MPVHERMIIVEAGNGIGEGANPLRVSAKRESSSFVLDARDEKRLRCRVQTDART